MLAESCPSKDDKASERENWLSSDSTCSRDKGARSGALEDAEDVDVGIGVVGRDTGVGEVVVGPGNDKEEEDGDVAEMFSLGFKT